MEGKSHLHIINRIWWAILTVVAIVVVIVLYGIHYNTSSKPQQRVMRHQQNQETRMAKHAGKTAVKTVPKQYRPNKHMKGVQRIKQSKQVKRTKQIVQKRMKK